jgi:hypothetical protein
VPAFYYTWVFDMVLGSVLVGFGPIFGVGFGRCGPSFRQSWARDRYQRPRLEKCFINHRKLAREIDSTLGILIHGFWAGVNFWGLGGPGGPNKQSKRWGASPPPHLLEWFLGPPGPPKLQKSTISGRPQQPCIKNPRVRIAPGCMFLHLGC